MADWYDSITDEWETLAKATLAEITDDHLFSVVQMLRKNIISEAIKAIQVQVGRVPTPYLIMQIGKDQPVGDVSVASYGYRLPLRFIYVDYQSPDAALDPPAYCRSRLDLLRTAFQTQGNLTRSQWTGEDGLINSSEEVAFADDNMTLYAAELTFETGFLTVLR